MAGPDVSIVIVNWNTRDRLAECLESVLRTAGTLAVETIVVDNASSDGSAAMVGTRFASARLIANPANAGFAAGTNQGLGVAQGRYLLLLNSDTVVRPDAMQRAVQFLDDHPRVGVVGAKMLNPDGTFQASFASFPTFWSECLKATTLGARLIAPSYPSPRPRPTDRPREVDWIPGAFMLARRALWETVGGLDESYWLYSEDTDWCYRIARGGWKVVYLPDVEIVHAQGASTSQRASESEAQLYLARVRFFATHYGVRRALVLRGALWLIFLARGMLSGLIAPLARSADRRDRWRRESRTCRRVRQTCVRPLSGAR
jgi:hypothetical protein